MNGNDDLIGTLLAKPPITGDDKDIAFLVHLLEAYRRMINRNIPSMGSNTLQRQPFTSDMGLRTDYSPMSEFIAGIGRRFP